MAWAGGERDKEERRVGGEERGLGERAERSGVTFEIEFLSRCYHNFVETKKIGSGCGGKLVWSGETRGIGQREIL